MELLQACLPPRSSYGGLHYLSDQGLSRGRINPRDLACALPNFERPFVGKPFGCFDSRVVVGQIHDPRRAEKVAVFLDRVKAIFGHRRPPFSARLGSIIVRPGSPEGHISQPTLREIRTRSYR